MVLTTGGVARAKLRPGQDLIRDKTSWRIGKNSGLEVLPRGIKTLALASRKEFTTALKITRYRKIKISAPTI